MEKIGYRFTRISSRIATVITIVIVALALMGMKKSLEVGETNFPVSESYDDSTLYDSGLFYFASDSFNSIVFNKSYGEYLDSVANATQIQIYLDSVETIKSSLIEEVGGYITRIAPRSRMSAENIVNLCIEHNFDITLLLSQGHQETHFATCGSNNCFGIKNGKRYTHPDLAVRDYIILMKNCYVADNDVDAALKRNLRYKNSSASYSTSSDYTARITQIRNDIIRTTNIKDMLDDVIELNKIIDELRDDLA